MTDFSSYPFYYIIGTMKDTTEYLDIEAATSASTNNLLAELSELAAPSEAPTPTTVPTTAPSNHYSTGVTSSVEERALQLLGSGVQAEAVAGALGVVPSRITQLLSNKVFAASVAELRYEALQSHNKRDCRYDSLEDRLIGKLENSLPLLMKPESILKAISTINAAKRRGQSAPSQITNQQTIVNLILPAAIVSKFTTNLDNQVIKAGEQDLLTMPSGNLLKQVEAAQEVAANIAAQTPKLEQKANDITE